MPQHLTQDAGAADPWRALRRQQDRRRYLLILTPRRTGKERPRRPSPSAGVGRQHHHLLASPAAMTRTATNQPDAEHVRAYLRHSCDLTMSGGVPAALLYPTAACALAEHYVFRRIAGASAASLAAAATAAAELGRGAPDPATEPEAPAVVPGFAGLAEAVGWLAGDDPPRSGQARPGATDAARHELWRLARMFQPSPATRPLFRVLAAIARWPSGTFRQATSRLLFALLAAPGRAGKVVMALLVLGSVLSWVGMSISLARGAQVSGTPLVVAASSSAVLLIVVALAAMFTVLLCYCSAVVRWLRGRAEPNLYGLVTGVSAAHRRGRVSRWVDRRAGVPEAGDTPAISTWLADRLDDLAGIPAGTDRALTFGDLWLGGTAERTLQDAELLRRAATDPELRTIDLLLVTANLSQGRPYRFPLPPAEPAGGTPFLFCEPCLESVLPQRIVVQLVKASPATETEHACPRHERGVLRELPDPWDVPVALAVRMSIARPGLLASVPLYSVQPASDDPGADEPGATAARTEWFVDAGPAGAPIDSFDRLLPRWPTFGLNLEPPAAGAAGQGEHGGVRLPEQDSARSHRGWRPVTGAAGFAAAATRIGHGWRDALHADLPGLRGRIARVRERERAGAAAPFLPQPAILRLAGLGVEAGTALRTRFLGRDGEIAGQDQTDRYRWIRLRLALRQYRALSVELGARLPLYTELAASYRVPAALTPWFAVRPDPGSLDPAWTDAATVVTTLRALGTGGVLDFDADDGAAPLAQQLRLDPTE